MIRKFVAFSAILAVAVTSGAAFGQVWNEVPDAPAGVPARQDTVGVGALTNIVGFTATADDDFHDTYSIIITDPNDFYATTANTVGAGTGSASFDTRLWLWDEQGNILMGNDDTFSDGLQSTLSDPSNFNGLTGGALSDNPLPLVGGRKYLLSIGGFNSDPFDAAGTDLVQLGFPNGLSDLSGPNPAAGPFASWSTGATGEYNIELGGATYCVPEPTSLGLLAFGFMGLLYGVRLKK
jgi:hypothetical protein